MSRKLIDANTYFSKNDIDVRSPRSRFDRSSSVKTSFNVGDLVPFYLDEVLPGDTFDVQTSWVARLQTLITPPFDDLYLDTYFFFVPARLCWEHWKEFNGESRNSWVSDTTYPFPTLRINPLGQSTNGFEKTLVDYFGLPITFETNIEVNRMPFNAYCLIWNEFFRDQNLQDEILVDISDGMVVAFPNDPSRGGHLLKACKLHDYFTSCLPSPQKGDPVNINYFLGEIPVRTSETSFDINRNSYPSLSWYSMATDDALSLKLVNNGQYDYQTVYSSTTADGVDGVISPSNLVADATALNVSLTINDLRLAIATQQLYELDARGGSRYVEILLNHFGVTAPDASLQRPELLSADRRRLTINQVVQNSQTADTPLGTTAAYSLTSNTDNSFFKSFTEHGFVIGLCVARYSHTYSQGIERMWLRNNRLDYYYPVFANIGEQPVYTDEIFADYAHEAKSDVFGYQEAWADYRYKPSRVTSEMRPNVENSLASWHFADDYATKPTLSSDWIEEDKANVDRCLAVTSKLADQIFGDFYIQNFTTRVMPVHSVPGLQRI